MARPKKWCDPKKYDDAGAAACVGHMPRVTQPLCGGGVALFVSSPDETRRKRAGGAMWEVGRAATARPHHERRSRRTRQRNDPTEYE